MNRRILIVQSDPAIVTMIENAIAQRQQIVDSAADYDAHLVASLREVFAEDLSAVDLLICDCIVADGSGLEVLAHVAENAPGLGVVLTGTPSDVRLAAESIRAEALDFVVTTERDLRTLPLVIEKCLAHQHIKLENGRLHLDLSRSLVELETKNQQLEALVHQLETMARTDELTGLSNRRWLNTMLAGSWAEASRHALPIGFIMIDLDGFKTLNDTVGHLRGDEILRQVGRVIEANTREVDVCARYGGDEFSVLLPHTNDVDAVAVAQRILVGFNDFLATMPRQEPTIGISVGVSHVNRSLPVNADQLVLHADEAMYASKELGGGRVIVRDQHDVRAA